MKVVRARAAPASADPELALQLIEAIGTDSFAERILASVGTVLPCSHCTVFGLRSNGRMEAVASASAVGEVASLTAIDYLRLGFDRLDSNTVWLSRRRPSRARQLWIGHQLASDVVHDTYRRLCYEEAGIRERLSLLSVFPDGYRASLSLYRNHAYEEFGSMDFAWLGMQGPLLAAAVMRHVRVFTQLPARAPQEQALIASLSGRERQVIAHIAEGKTTKEAAREMGVSVTTAATYRYRAFQHLGVRSMAELFALMRSTAAQP
jgi:DNA-binding CsgD family transcriptional regulator